MAVQCSYSFTDRSVGRHRQPADGRIAKKVRDSLDAGLNPPRSPWRPQRDPRSHRAQSPQADGRQRLSQHRRALRPQAVASDCVRPRWSQSIAEPLAAARRGAQIGQDGPGLPTRQLGRLRLDRARRRHRHHRRSLKLKVDGAPVCVEHGLVHRLRQGRVREDRADQVGHGGF